MGFVHTTEHMDETIENKGEISDAMVRKWRCFGWRERWEVGPRANSKAVARDIEIP